MEETFQVNHLRQNELDYELAIRDLSTDRVVADKRKILKRALAKEVDKPDALVNLAKYKVNYDEESSAISDTLEAICTAIVDFEGHSTDSVFKTIKSRINHVAGRIRRMKIPVTNSDVASKFQKESKVTCFQLEADLLEKAEVASGDPNASFSLNSGPVINVPAPSVTYIPKSSSVSKWSVHFDGNPKTVFSFIERVTELALSRKVSDQDLFNSAVELFVGDAFVWFRSVKNVVTDWDSLVARLKSDFLPPNTEDDLWNQIKARKQKKHESITIFIAQIENLFKRLSKSPAEPTKVKHIRQNLLPVFINQLALVEINTVSELIKLCKKLEEAMHIQNNVSCVFEISPSPVETVSNSGNHSFVQKTSAVDSRKIYPNKYTPRKRNGSVNKNSFVPTVENNIVQNNAASLSVNKSISCWNCLQPNHTYSTCRVKRKIFCYKCGHRDVKVSNCPVCSKNA